MSKFCALISHPYFDCDFEKVKTDIITAKQKTETALSKAHNKSAIRRYRKALANLCREVDIVERMTFDTWRGV